MVRRSSEFMASSVGSCAEGPSEIEMDATWTGEIVCVKDMHKTLASNIASQVFAMMPKFLLKDKGCFILVCELDKSTRL